LAFHQVLEVLFKGFTLSGEILIAPLRFFTHECSVGPSNLFMAQNVSLSSLSGLNSLLPRQGCGGIILGRFLEFDLLGIAENFLNRFARNGNNSFGWLVINACD
jgi:hypothetical protein